MPPGQLAISPPVPACAERWAARRPAGDEL